MRRTSVAPLTSWSLAALLLGGCPDPSSSGDAGRGDGGEFVDATARDLVDTDSTTADVPFTPESGTALGQLELEATEVSIGIRAPFTGDNNGNATAWIEFRRQGAAAWRRGVDLVLPARAGMNYWHGSLMYLETGVTYEVRVGVDDPDGVSGVAAGSVTTARYLWPEDQGRALHVKPGTAGADCDDSWVGTQAQPWCTLAKAAIEVAAGDTIYLLPGVYHDQLILDKSGQPGAPISVVGLGDGVVLDGSRPEYLRSDAWQLEESLPGDTLDGAVYSLAMDQEPDLVVAGDDERLFHPDSWDEFLNGSHWDPDYLSTDPITDGWFYQNGRLHLRLPGGGNPADVDMHINAYPDDGANAIRVYDQDWVNIRNLSFRFTNWGIHFKAASHVRVADCDFRHFKTAIVHRNGGDRNLFEDNTFHDSRLFGWPWHAHKANIQQTGSISLKIEDESHHGSGSMIRRNTIDGSANGIYVNHRNSDVYGNTVTHTVDDAFELDCLYGGYYTENLRIWDNTTVDTFVAASLAPMKGLTYLVGNRFIGFRMLGVKIRTVVDSDGPVFFWHNTLYSDFANPYRSVVAFSPPQGPVMSNFNVRNNIIYGHDDVVRHDYSGLDSVSNSFDGDLMQPGADGFWEWNNQAYADIAALRAGLGFEQNGIEGPTGLVEPVTGQGLLQPTSQAIDHAATIPGLHCLESLETDPAPQDCRPYRGTAPDIGATEF